MVLKIQTTDQRAPVFLSQASVHTCRDRGWTFQRNLNNATATAVSWVPSHPVFPSLGLLLFVAALSAA